MTNANPYLNPDAFAVAPSREDIAAMQQAVVDPILLGNIAYRAFMQFQGLTPVAWEDVPSHTADAWDAAADAVAAWLLADKDAVLEPGSPD